MAKKDTLNNYLKETKEREEFKKWKRNQQQKSAKKKYNDENYSSLQVHLDKEVVEQFKGLVKKLGFSQSEVIRFFVIDFMENHNDYVESVEDSKDKKTFNYDEYHNSYELKSLQNRLESLKTEEEIIKYFHDPYQVNSKRELLPFAKYLGFDFTYHSKRADIVYSIQKYYIDKL